MRGRVRIQFVDQHGTHEAGVDGGGLFKDFMEGLVKEGFSPATCVPWPLCQGPGFGGGVAVLCMFQLGSV